MAIVKTTRARIAAESGQRGTLCPGYDYGEDHQTVRRPIREGRREKSAA
jgi:hypothetical protein